jgi:hypothetical protein
MAAPRDRRAVLLVTIGLIVAATGVATIGLHAHWSPDGRAASDAVLAALCLATGAVCFTRYRAPATHPLSSARVLVVPPDHRLRPEWILSDLPPWEGLTFRALGWFAAWLAP